MTIYIIYGDVKKRVCDKMILAGTQITLFAEADHTIHVYRFIYTYNNHPGGKGSTLPV